MIMVLLHIKKRLHAVSIVLESTCKNLRISFMCARSTSLWWLCVRSCERASPCWSGYFWFYLLLCVFVWKNGGPLGSLNFRAKKMRTAKKTQSRQNETKRNKKTRRPKLWLIETAVKTLSIRRLAKNTQQSATIRYNTKIKATETRSSMCFGETFLLWWLVKSLPHTLFVHY